jgi:hypothetical protein
VDIQGFFNTNFVPKEMSITLDGINVYNYLFKPTTPYNKLSTKERREVRWLENNHHKIRYSDGFIHAGDIKAILRKFKFDTIVVRGHQKAEFLKPFARYISDVQDDCLKYEIGEHSCPNHSDEFAMCANVNVRKLREYINSKMSTEDSS